MKIFFSENQPDYSTYTFNYAVYCLKEAQEELPAIYNKGFLPYTGNLQLQQEVFYLARSLRVDLGRFEDTSENRRVNRRMEPLGVQLTAFEKKDFDYAHPEFFAFCMNYAADRFSGNAMTTERLNYVLSRDTGSHILQFSNKDQILGYVLAAIEGDILHYWFAFFDQQYLKTHSLGKWMMWRTIRWAKKHGLSHVYLGTCYGKHSLYKVRDHKGLAFFDGCGWNEGVKLLKDRCKTDYEDLSKDRFKLLEAPNLFLENLPPTL